MLKQIGLEPPTFDVHVTASHQTQLVSSFVRRTLFKVVHGARSAPSDFTLAPDLALEAAASADRRVYTITLRPGVRWESRPPVNGRALVAADVKFSLERVLRMSPFAPLLGPVERVEAPDRRTVRVRLADSFTPFVHNLAEPWTAILPPEAVDRPAGPTAVESLIGCGPFVLERYEPGVKAIFSRNPTYHAPGLPYLDKVEWLFIKDRPTRLALFRAGQVDLPSHDARIPGSEADALRKANAGYPIMSWDGLEVRSLAMRADRPPFNDVRVRRALSLAVDRKTWAAEHLGGEGGEPPGAVPSAMRPWTLAARQLGEGARYLEHDPAQARALLAEAGFAAGLRIKCTTWPGYGPEYVEDLERLAGHLRRAGVELQIVNEEYGQYIRGSFLGRFDEATWGPSSIFTDVDGYLHTFFRSGQAGNRSHVADSQVDAMIEAQRRVTSPSSRKRLIDEIQRRSAAQAWYVFTPCPRNVSSWAPWVRNYGPKNSFDRGAQLEVVWLEPG